MIPNAEGARGGKLGRARIFALWLVLLVPVLPVEEAFGILACAHANTASADVAHHPGFSLNAHNHSPDAGDGGSESHGACTWFGPCAGSPVALHNSADAVEITVTLSQRAVSWDPAEIGLPDSLAFLRPRAIPPPLSA